MSERPKSSEPLLEEGSHRSAMDPVAAIAMSRIELGRSLRTRRQGIDRRSNYVAERIGYKPPSYVDIENGKTSSDKLHIWFGIADALDLDPTVLVARAWETRPIEGFNLRLPPEGDERRRVLLEVAVEQAAEDYHKNRRKGIAD